MVKLEFYSAGSLISFIKKSLYMTESSALKKVLKWKSKSDLTLKNNIYTLHLAEKNKIDKEFNAAILKKYTLWKKSGMKITLESQKHLR